MRLFSNIFTKAFIKYCIIVENVFFSTFYGSIVKLQLTREVTVIVWACIHFVPAHKRNSPVFKEKGAASTPSYFSASCISRQKYRKNDKWKWGLSTKFVHLFYQQCWVYCFFSFEFWCAYVIFYFTFCFPLP